MMRQGLRLLSRNFGDIPKYPWRYSTLPQASLDKTTAHESDASTAIDKKQSRKEFRNNITIEGVMEEKCNYWKDDNDHITSVTFTLRHEVQTGSFARFSVRGRSPGVIHFLLTKTDAGTKVRVTGRLIEGWRSSPDELRILARSIKLDKTESS